MTYLPISRRSFLRSTSLVASSAWLASRGLLAQVAVHEAALPAVIVQGRAGGAKAKIVTKSLRGGVSALMGSGGNIAVLPGKDGKIMVDSGYSTSQPQITEALIVLSGDPLRHLINTHWHFDHTDGNDWVHADGATILAHEKTKERMSTPQTMVAFGATIPASPVGALPTATFSEKKTVKLNGATLMMHHYEPAHTDTDISIYFVEADVLHVGDTWFNGFYPFIDYSSGGSIDGMIQATERNLRDAKETTIVIPGHGPIGTRAELVEYRDVLVAARTRVAALKKQGKTLDEVVATKPMGEYDAKWGAGFMPTDRFLGLVYQGV